MTTHFYRCERGHKSKLEVHPDAPAPDSMKCEYRMLTLEPEKFCPYTAHLSEDDLLDAPQPPLSPRLDDIAESLAFDLGELLPWLDPALRFLTSEHFDVERRKRVMHLSAGAFVEDFAGHSCESRLKDMSISDLEDRADHLLGMFLVAKAMELRKRAANA